jgi:hypothetical protein
MWLWVRMAIRQNMNIIMNITTTTIMITMNIANVATIITNTNIVVAAVKMIMNTVNVAALRQAQGPSRERLKRRSAMAL